MAKEYQFNWRVNVPESLKDGAVFDMWEEETSSLVESNCLFRVDDDGFYIYWSCDGKETQIVDLTQIFEAKPGFAPKDPKLVSDLESRATDRSESLEDRSMVISTGLDLVNITFYRLVAKDAQTARTWRQDLNTILHNTKIAHVCPMTCLRKHWKMLCLSVNERRKIPAKSVTRTFASGKTEKLVHKCLIELGLCGARDDDIDPDIFTFENFYDLYLKICPRTDVHEAFNLLSGGAEFLGVDCLVAFLNDKQRDPRLNEILFPFFNHSRVMQLIQKYEANRTLVEKGRLSFDGFLKFLMSDENAPVFLDRVERYQDLDQPLCHYLINSSHNTYLIGRQFGGRSSVEMYRQVLISGCRCIELDIWDGKGTGIDEPIITHGKAMCTDIPFKDVIYAIRDTAFMTSDLPVILSFENHCSKSNQLKMAQYCQEIFGDLLLSQPLDSNPLEPGVPLPSPNQLRNKILIKNKRLKPDVEMQQLAQYLNEGKLEGEEEEEVPEDPDAIVGEDGPLESEFSNNIQEMARKSASKRSLCHQSAVSNYEDESSSTEGEESDSIDAKPNFNQIAHVRTTNVKKTHASGAAIGELTPPTSVVDNDAHPELRQGPTTFLIKSKFKALTTKTKKEKEKEKEEKDRNDDDDIESAMKPSLTKEEEEQLMAVYHYTGATTNIHPLLSAMVNYTHPIKFQGFDIAESNNCHFHMSSFSESTGLGLLKQSALEFVNYNKRQSSRIYPKGGRVDSSNFLPQIFWNVGVQMVALNFQTPDLALQLNQGKFEYNGSCGYLLKPDFMRRTDRMFDPFSELPVDGVIAAFCSVRVISGQFLSDRKMGTYVEVEMYGLPTDTIRKEFKTRTVPANGLNPFYNEEPFVFRKVVLPELAVLRFAVYDENGKLLGQRILPLDGLQAGYRHVSLRSETNFPMTLPTLFCHIVIKTYVPDGLNNLVDALADPKAYIKSQKAAAALREKQMIQMGIEKDEIGEVPQKRNDASCIVSKQPSDDKGGAISNGSQMPSRLSNQGSSQSLVPSTPFSNSVHGSTLDRASSSGRIITDAGNAEPAKFKLLPIHFDDLKKDKIYSKLVKKHAKEVEDMNKRQQKDQQTMQKLQQQAIDKVMGDQIKLPKKHNGSISSPTSPTMKMRSPTLDADQDERIKKLVSEHTDEWSNMMKRILEERHRLNSIQSAAQRDTLKKLLQESLDGQLKQLRTMMDEESKKLKANQTKNSMEAAKKIMSDKTIKNKAEKDRRVKELNEKNLKTIMQERKILALKQQKVEEQLKKQHIEQQEQFEKITRKELELTELLQKEEVLAVKPETVV